MSTRETRYNLGMHFQALPWRGEGGNILNCVYTYLVDIFYYAFLTVQWITCWNVNYSCCCHMSLLTISRRWGWTLSSGDRNIKQRSPRSIQCSCHQLPLQKCRIDLRTFWGLTVILSLSVHGFVLFLTSNWLSFCNSLPRYASVWPIFKV